jgi:hypothetical protein
MQAVAIIRSPDRRGRHRVLPVAGRRGAAEAVAKRLDQLDRRLSRMERDSGFGRDAGRVRPLLADTTPPLPEPAQAARAKVGKRYEAFVAALGRRSPRDRNFGRRSEDVGGRRQRDRERSRLQRAWINSIARPPFSCICTPRYYDGRYLLNRPNFGSFNHPDPGTSVPRQEAGTR